MPVSVVTFSVVVFTVEVFSEVVALSVDDDVVFVADEVPASFGLLSTGATGSSISSSSSTISASSGGPVFKGHLKPLKCLPADYGFSSSTSSISSAITFGA